MPRSLLLPVALAGGCLGAFILGMSHGLEAQERVAIPIRDTTLANGLQVIVAEDHRTPMFTAMVALRAGASAQGPETRGMAHLFEHILFRGFGRDPQDFAREVAKLRGAYNGATSEDMVTYYVMAPASEVSGTVDVLSRLVTAGRFDEDDLREELPVLLDEMARSYDQPTSGLKRRMAPRLWGPGWHRRDVLGDSVSLAGLTLGDLRDHYARFYVPANAALIVTGDAKAEEVFAEAAHRFEGWKSRSRDLKPATAPVATSQLASTSLVLLSDALPDVTVNVSLLGPGLAGDWPSVAALQDVTSTLSDPGLAFQSQMVTNGPFNQLDVEVAVSAEATVIEFDGSLDPEQAVAGVRALLWGLSNLGTFLAVDPTQQIAAARLAELRSALLLERTPILAPIIARNWSAGRPLDLIWDGELTPLAEQRAVADAFLTRKPSVIGVVGPQGAIEAIQSTLGGGGTP